MGVRLHSATKRIVEYSTSAYFNYELDIINQIIEVLAEYDISFSDESIDYSYTLEANKTNLQKNLQNIINPNDTWGYQEELNKLVDEIVQKGVYTKQDVYENLKKLVDVSDNQDIVYFCWF
jgi:hypothetical protein